MKNIFYTLIVFLSLYACTPADITTTEEAGSKQELMEGTWQLTSLKQKEMQAIEKNFPAFASEKDLTETFPGHPYTDFRITFKSDGTFTSETGNSYVSLLSSGKWQLDNKDFPTKIIFSDDNETLEMLVGSWGNLIFNKFMLAEERIDPVSGKTVIRYEYNFDKTK